MSFSWEDISYGDATSGQVKGGTNYNPVYAGFNMPEYPAFNATVNADGSVSTKATSANAEQINYLIFAAVGGLALWLLLK